MKAKVNVQWMGKERKVNRHRKKRSVWSANGVENVSGKTGKVVWEADRVVEYSDTEQIRVRTYIAASRDHHNLTGTTQHTIPAPQTHQYEDHITEKQSQMYSISVQIPSVYMYIHIYIIMCLLVSTTVLSISAPWLRSVRAFHVKLGIITGQSMETVIRG